jgi:hypothetical protein
MRILIEVQPGLKTRQCTQQSVGLESEADVPGAQRGAHSVGDLWFVGNLYGWSLFFSFSSMASPQFCWRARSALVVERVTELIAAL